MNGIANILFVVFAGLGALLVAIPLPKALASGNVGTSMLIMWTEVACLVQEFNALRWNGNIKNWDPAWCVFCGYFLVAADVALVASSVSINRRLYMIVTLDPRRHEKAFVFNTIVDIVLCVVIPWASVALQFVVQQYRFFIYEDIGCVSGVGTVNLAFPLVWMLPLLLGVVSAVYACLTMRENFRWRHSLTGDLRVNSTWSRRLMTLGVLSTLYGLVPTSMSIVLLATAYPVTAWPGWRAMHSTIDVIVYVTAQEWQSKPALAVNLELRRWTTATLAFAIFVLLGLTSEVKRMYWAPFKSVIERSFSADQTGTVHGQNADGQPNDEWVSRLFPFRQSRCSILFGKAYVEKRRESFRQSNRPRSDSDVEGIQLVLPISQPPVAMHPTHLSWKLDYESGSYPASP